MVQKKPADQAIFDDAPAWFRRVRAPFFAAVQAIAAETQRIGLVTHGAVHGLLLTRVALLPPEPEVAPVGLTYGWVALARRPGAQHRASAARR